MKKYLSAIPLVLLVCFVAGCKKTNEVSEEPSIDIVAERAALLEAHNMWIKAVTEKDVDGMFSLAADDSVFLANGGLQNKEFMSKYWADAFAAGSYWSPVPPEKIVLSASGDMAFVIGGTQFTRLVEGEAQTGEKYFTYFIWKKQGDGSWKLIALK